RPGGASAPTSRLLSIASSTGQSPGAATVTAHTGGDGAAASGSGTASGSGSGSGIARQGLGFGTTPGQSGLGIRGPGQGSALPHRSSPLAPRLALSRDRAGNTNANANHDNSNTSVNVVAPRPATAISKGSVASMRSTESSDSMHRKKSKSLRQAEVRGLVSSAVSRFNQGASSPSATNSGSAPGTPRPVSAQSARSFASARSKEQTPKRSVPELIAEDDGAEKEKRVDDDDDDGKEEDGDQEGDHLMVPAPTTMTNASELLFRRAGVPPMPMRSAMESDITRSSLVSDYDDEDDDESEDDDEDEEERAYIDEQEARDRIRHGKSPARTTGVTTPTTTAANAGTITTTTGTNTTTGLETGTTTATPGNTTATSSTQQLPPSLSLADQDPMDPSKSALAYSLASMSSAPSTTLARSRRQHAQATAQAAGLGSAVTGSEVSTAPAQRNDNDEGEGEEEEEEDDGKRVKHVAEHQNPEIVHPPLGVESAVASLLGGESSVGGGGGVAPSSLTGSAVSYVPPVPQIPAEHRYAGGQGQGQGQGNGGGFRTGLGVGSPLKAEVEMSPDPSRIERDGDDGERSSRQSRHSRRSFGGQRSGSRAEYAREDERGEEVEVGEDTGIATQPDQEDFGMELRREGDLDNYSEGAASRPATRGSGEDGGDEHEDDRGHGHGHEHEHEHEHYEHGREHAMEGESGAYYNPTRSELGIGRPGDVSNSPFPFTRPRKQFDSPTQSLSELNEGHIDESTTASIRAAAAAAAARGSTSPNSRLVAGGGPAARGSPMPDLTKYAATMSEMTEGTSATALPQDSTVDDRLELATNPSVIDDGDRPSEHLVNLKLHLHDVPYRLYSST
ncbi:hypothetical protein KEM55_002825, partial [Ascosphaera atra]